MTCCATCGETGWRSFTPSIPKWFHTDSKLELDHDFVLPAPTEDEQDRRDRERVREMGHHVHRGQEPDCPWCADVTKNALRLSGGLVQEADF